MAPTSVPRVLWHISGGRCYPWSLPPTVTSCRDPGDAEHSRRVVSSPKFPVGSTVQYICDKGYILAGTGTLTCHDRIAGGPKWSDRLPKCIRELGTPSLGVSLEPATCADATVSLHHSGDV